MMLVQNHQQPQPGCGSSSSSHQKSTVNPFRTDKELQSLVRVVKNIHSVGIFTRWHTTFMEKLNTVASNLIEDEGAMDKARQTNAVLLQQTKRMDKILQIISKVMKVCNSNKTEEEHDALFQAKAQNAIHRLREVCLGGVNQLRHFVPTSDTKNTVAGYNQFQWMVVQLGNGFEVYGHLLWQHDTLQDIKEKLQRLVNDNHNMVILVVDAINNYQEQIRSICNTIVVMTGPTENLGLFPVMMKMREFEGDTSFAQRANNMIGLLLQGDVNDTSDSSDDDDQEDHDRNHQDQAEGSLPDLVPMKSTTTATATTSKQEEDEDHTCTTDDDVSQSENSSSSSSS